MKSIQLELVLQKKVQSNDGYSEDRRGYSDRLGYLQR